MNTVETTYASCTPHRPGARFHISYDDFDEIALDIYNSGALRAFQVATDQRIRWLRRTHGIPATHLPSADDLWIAMPFRAVEELTLKRVGHSVCQRILAEESIEDAPPSLLELGFIRRRFVARRTSRVIKDVPATVYIEKDDEGHEVEFIVVDEVGDYIGIDGKDYSAPLQGFGLIERQYLYCIEAIRAAIAALDYLEPPEPAPRWEAMIERREPKGQKGGVTEAQRTANSFRASGDATTNEQGMFDARRGTTYPRTSEFTMSFAKENNIAIPALSSEIDEKSMRNAEPVKPLYSKAQQFMLYRDTVDSSAVRVGLWCPETIIALSSRVLDIPARPDGSDEEALLQWLADWLEPARRLYAATITLSPVRAWEHIDLTTRYMATPGSPSWWQREPEPGSKRDWRKTKAPVTLRNVADRYIFEYDDFQRNKNAWYPSVTTPYDGPPLLIDGDESYEGTGQLVGSVAVTEVPAQAPDRHEEPLISGLGQDEATRGNEAPERDEEPRTDELAAPLNDEPATNEGTTVLPLRRRSKGMNLGATEHLEGEIAKYYPGLIGQRDEIKPGRYLLYIWYGDGDDQWFDMDLVAWWHLTPELQGLIDQAVLYAASLEGGGSSPPCEEDIGESEENNTDEQGGRENPGVFQGGIQDPEEASEAPPLRDVSLVGAPSHRGDDSRGGVQAAVRDGGP